ncbi:MAG: hypothetical protein AAGI91_11300 [Bacteroidota bacterium]
MRSFILMLAGLALGLGACQSPDDQTYDPVLDEEIDDPDAPLVPDGFKPGLAARVRYDCAGDETFFVSRSDDGRTAVVTLDDQSVTLESEDGGTYLSDDAVYRLSLRGTRASLDLGAEDTYVDCERQGA